MKNYFGLALTAAIALAADLPTTYYAKCKFNVLSGDFKGTLIAR